MNNAELIVRTLKSAGVEHGFGIPSGNVLPLMDAMRRHGLPFVLTAHEGSAAFAADVTGRLTGVPGLAIATLGPGATNLATGVGSAFLDRSPMIAITCNLDSHQMGRRIQMYIDHQTLFGPITKASLILRDGEVADQVAEAVTLALSEPVGPVHLDLPEDVALAPAKERVPRIADPKGAASPSRASLVEAMALIRAASRPIVVIGANALRMRNSGLLLRFLKRHGLPFATTTMAKGLVDDGAPMAIGCIERAKRQMQRQFLQGSDLIVGIGYDTVEVEFEAWIGHAPLLQVDIEEPDLPPSVDCKLTVVGDLDAALSVFCDFEPAKNNWTPEELDTHRSEFQRALRPVSPDFAPHQVIDIVRDVLSADGILAFDVGAHTHQIASQWDVPGADRFLITNGWSSMGFGLPAAIAAGLARPQQPVVCLIGDGCFQMTCGELVTAKRLGLSLPVVVLDDRWLGLIKVKQERRQIPHYGTALQEEDYRDPPEHYFGVPAVVARDGTALRSHLAAALKADHPTVIEAIVDPGHYSETVFD